MPAGVHHRRLDPVDANLPDGAGIGEARLFLDRQPVHVGAYQHDRAVAVLQHADHAGAADLLGDLHAFDRAQRRGHLRGGALFLEREFGVAVEIVPHRGERLVVIGPDRGGIIRLGGRRLCERTERGGGEKQRTHGRTPVVFRRVGASHVDNKRPVGPIVIASGAKQSSVGSGRPGLPRYARNDGGYIRSVADR